MFFLDIILNTRDIDFIIQREIAIAYWGMLPFRTYPIFLLPYFFLSPWTTFSLPYLSLLWPFFISELFLVFLLFPFLNLLTYPHRFTIAALRHHFLLYSHMLTLTKPLLWRQTPLVNALFVPRNLLKDVVLLLTSFPGHCHSEPTSYKEASSVPQWQHVMTDELVAVRRTLTWNLVCLPLGKSTIGCKYIYNIKTKADGSIKRYKA